MKRLPTIDQPTCNDTLQSYGCKVLAFVLTTGVTATLSDRDLELADHVYPLAIANPEIASIAVDNLSRARTLVLAAIATRRKLTALEAVERTPATPDTPIGSHAVKLIPPAVPLAPAGALADRPF